MNFNTTLLTTPSECDTLLTIAAKEDESLEFRKTSLNRQLASYSATGTTVDQDLAATNAEVAALQNIVATLPEGNSRTEQLTKLKRAELKQFLLNQKDKNYGSVSLLGLELDLARTQQELDVVTGFISEINARKQLVV